MSDNLTVTETIYVKKHCPFKACIFYADCDFDPCYIKDEFKQRNLIRDADLL